MSRHPRVLTTSANAARSATDSSGVAAIVSLYKRLRDLGCDMHLVGVHDQPSRIFHLLQLDQVFAP